MTHNTKPLFKRLYLYPARWQPQRQAKNIRKFNGNLYNRWHLARGGMFGLSGIVLPNFLLAKLGFLSKYGVGFNNFIKKVGDKSTFLFILFGFILILAFKNSTKNLEQLQFNFNTILLSVALFAFSILSLNKISEFLYFNF